MRMIIKIGRAFEALRLELVLFVVALCIISYLFGVKSVWSNIYPYPLIQEAKVAWKAWREVEPSDLPMNILGWEKDDAPVQPVRRLGDGGGPETLLIAGGFYQRLDLCPEHGCLAWVLDRQGRVLRTWSAAPEAIFPKLTGFSGRTSDVAKAFYVVAVALGPDGGLVANLQGRNIYPYHVGTAKFDAAGKLQWAKLDHGHHWPTIGPDGRIYTPFVRLTKTMPEIAPTATATRCEGDTVQTEGVRVLSPAGVVLKEFFMPDLVARGDYPGLTYATRDGCDPFHVNGVALVNAAGAVKMGVDAGDLLVSLREQSALVVLDKDTGDIRRVYPGRASGQHSPHVLPDGDILVFDNFGGPKALGGSRVLRLNPQTGATQTVFPRRSIQGFTPFFSDRAGVLCVHPHGSRALVSASRQGRIFEIDLATGEPEWSLDNVIDLKPFIEARKLGDKVPGVRARFSTQGACYVKQDGARWVPVA